ncbi:MAG TPA: hypothetical protein VN671_13890 [Solirubrobacterales bacterium]|nr:hypothetical protein [Solirubrobacterales bacterium]
MFRRTANAFAVAAVLALVLGAAFASNALGATGGQAEVETRFELTGSHGYRILVSARERTVTIGVSKGSTQRAGSSTTYVARGSAGTHGFYADFHQFGRVNVHFHRTSKAVRGLPPDCFGGGGGADTIEGYFTGTFEFEGEDGYTSVKTNRVKGEMVLPPTEQCPLVAGGAYPLLEDPNAELPPAKTRMTLQAVNKAGTGGLVFVARREGKTGFFAERFGTIGRIGILSVAYALGPQKTFVTNPQVSFGKVQPPKPFFGTGTLERAKGGKRVWGGDLTASFPGQGKVALTGTEFHTTLARSFP